MLKKPRICYFVVKYILIANKVVNYIYSVHFKSFTINALEIFTKSEFILTKIEKKNQNKKKQITENLDVIEQNGLQIRLQHVKISNKNNRKQ